MYNGMNGGCRTVREGAQGHRCHVSGVSFCRLAFNSIERDEDLYFDNQLIGTENFQQTLDFVNHQQAIAKRMGKEAYLRSFQG